MTKLKTENLVEIFDNKKKALNFQQLFKKLNVLQEKELTNLLLDYKRLKDDLKKSKMLLLPDVEQQFKILIKEFQIKLLKQERQILTDILPVIDSLEISLSYINPNDKELKKGIENTLKKFKKILKNYDVEEVQHDFFDPKFHQAAGIEDTKDKKTNEIIKVLQKGYRKKDKLIRQSIVIIAK